MKLFALLFLLLSAVSGKAWGYGVPAISVGEDSELLTDTPIPIPHLTATPTITDTSLPTFTFTPTTTPTSQPTQTAIPTLVETVTLSPVGRMPLDKPTPSPTRDPSDSFQEQGFFGCKRKISKYYSTPRTKENGKLYICKL